MEITLDEHRPGAGERRLQRDFRAGGHDGSRAASVRWPVSNSASSQPARNQR